jgi:hypothetical protein
MSGVIVHSAIRLNLNLWFLSVGLSNVWIRRDDRLCMSFVLVRKQAVQNGRYYHSLCIDNTLRCTARSPVRRPFCITRIVFVHFLSGTLCCTFNDPRTASFLYSFHFSLHIRQWLSDISVNWILFWFAWPCAPAEALNLRQGRLLVACLLFYA